MATAKKKQDHTGGYGGGACDGEEDEEGSGVSDQVQLIDSLLPLPNPPGP